MTATAGVSPRQQVLQQNQAKNKTISYEEMRQLKRDYQQVCREFDALERDLYRAHEQDALMSSFMHRHRDYLDRVQFEYSPEVRNVLTDPKRVISDPNKVKPDQSKTNETLLDDLSVLNKIQVKKSREFNPSSTTDENDNHRLLADIFRRASQGSNFRLTYERCTNSRELDRREPLRWAQLAIRHNPNDFKACYWYMITAGRYSEIGLSARDRVLAGEAFKRGIYRCLLMEPRDPLAHHLLGRYYYHIGGLNWLQRTICKNFYNFELTGSYEEAEHELRHAYTIRQDWMPVGLWMARVLLAQKKPMEEVRHWIELGLKMKIEEPSTELERRELVELARKLGIPAEGLSAEDGGVPQ